MFNNSYSEAISIFLILGLSIPFRYVATNVGGVLLTNKYMRIKVWNQGIVAIFNVSLNMLLIRYYGIKGAAFATVLSELFLLSLYLYAVKNNIFGRAALTGWHLNVKKVTGA